MGPIRNPLWEQKRTEGYVIVFSIGGVTVSVLASSAVGRGFEFRSSQSKTTKLIFAASPVSTQH